MYVWQGNRSKRNSIMSFIRSSTTSFLFKDIDNDNRYVCMYVKCMYVKCLYAKCLYVCMYACTCVRDTGMYVCMNKSNMCMYVCINKILYVCEQ